MTMLFANDRNKRVYGHDMVDTHDYRTLWGKEALEYYYSKDGFGLSRVDQSPFADLQMYFDYLQKQLNSIESNHDYYKSEIYTRHLDNCNLKFVQNFCNCSSNPCKTLQECTIKHTKHESLKKKHWINKLEYDNILTLVGMGEDIFDKISDNQILSSFNLNREKGGGYDFKIVNSLHKHLIKAKLISETTNHDEFKKVFSGKINDRIEWTGNKSELYYLIKSLHEIHFFTEGKYWHLVNNCFAVNFDIEGLNKSKKPSDGKQNQIDKIIKNLELEL